MVVGDSRYGGIFVPTAAILNELAFGLGWQPEHSFPAALEATVAWYATNRSWWDTVKSGKTTENMSLGIELFLGIIGVFTLLIGGIGVANIMYAVVRERTREIGVKMALGAKRRWIIIPFVAEGLVYTLIGGALGITIATLIVAALSFVPIESNRVLSFLGRPTLSPQIGIATSLILGTIGLLAGYFPARRAASVDPAATLRYE